MVIEKNTYRQPRI